MFLTEKLVGVFHQENAATHINSLQMAFLHFQRGVPFSPSSLLRKAKQHGQGGGNKEVITLGWGRRWEGSQLPLGED